MENEIIRKSATCFANKLNVYIGKEGLDYKKMVLGTEVLIVNISKVIIMYLLAATLGVFVHTLIIHIAYVAIKRFSFGLYALNSSVCTIVSCALLVAVPWGLQGVGIGNATVLAVFTAVVLCLYKYAPADTKARPLIGKVLRTKLRKKAVICGTTLLAIALVIPNNEAKLLITLGAVFQCVSILPITYKILKRSERNYETYEQVGQDRRQA